MEGGQGVFDLQQRPSNINIYQDDIFEYIRISIYIYIWKILLDEQHLGRVALSGGWGGSSHSLRALYSAFGRTGVTVEGASEAPMSSAIPRSLARREYP